MAIAKKKETGTNVINFRCPDSLKSDIAKIGKDYYPNDKNDRGYDLTSTILAILSKGIEGIAKEGLCITDSKTECNTLDNFTATKTELEAAIAEVKTQLQNELGEFKSLVFDEVVTMGVVATMIETAIDNRLKSFPLGSVASLKQETIQPTQPEPLPLLDELEKATDNTAIAVETITSDNNLAITEILPSQDAILESLKQSKDDSQEMVGLALNGLKRDELRGLVSHMKLTKDKMQGKGVNDQKVDELKKSLLNNGITIEIFREWEKKNAK